MSITVSASFLMCHVCGCPGGGEEEGVEGPGHNKTVGYSDCSGHCDGEQVILIIGTNINIDVCMWTDILNLICCQ